MSFARKYAVLMILIAGTACAPIASSQETNPAEAPKPAPIEVAPNGTEVHVGDKVQFKAVAKDASGNVMDAKPTVWFAAPFDVAGADDKGVVVFHQPGIVTVGVVINQKPGIAHAPFGTPPVAKIDITPVSMALAVGGSTVLSATARSSNGDPRTDTPIQWKSSTPAVAKIDASGLVTAIAPGTAKFQATAGPVSAETSLHGVAEPVQSISVSPVDTNAKTGDVVHFTAAAKGAKGAVKDVLTSWSVSGAGAAIYPDGGFVAVRPGTYLVRASIGRHDAVASITVAPRNAERNIEVVAHIPSKNPTDGTVLQPSEQWIVGKHLYVSTIADRVYSYDISDPANPKALDSMKVDARLINDVSTTPDEKVGVFTRGGGSNRKNGIVFFDASDPAHLKVLSEYTETVTGGVHSAFINTHYVYITDDATGSLRMIHFKDSAHPKEVARWQTENATAQTVVGPLGPSETGRYLHDLYVKDGLAYLAYWRDGMIILDVGNGIKGGSPEHPQLGSPFQ